MTPSKHPPTSASDSIPNTSPSSMPPDAPSGELQLTLFSGFDFGVYVDTRSRYYERCDDDECGCQK